MEGTQGRNNWVRKGLAPLRYPISKCERRRIQYMVVEVPIPSRNMVDLRELSVVSGSSGCPGHDRRQPSASLFPMRNARMAAKKSPTTAIVGRCGPESPLVRGPEARMIAASLQIIQPAGAKASGQVPGKARFYPWLYFRVFVSALAAKQSTRVKPAFGLHIIAPVSIRILQNRWHHRQHRHDTTSVRKTGVVKRNSLHEFYCSCGKCITRTFV
jgi:hypothetical protein